ncbi:MAG: exosortase/archaeosortase family protein, partial [Candidatus Tectomicrobia bacterium]|nr:exosortase/archaeosortase family protein [Candidatus Tectomicrobia bacterium]
MARCRAAPDGRSGARHCRPAQCNSAGNVHPSRPAVGPSRRAATACERSTREPRRSRASGHDVSSRHPCLRCRGVGDTGAVSGSGAGACGLRQSAHRARAGGLDAHGDCLRRACRGSRAAPEKPGTRARPMSQFAVLLLMQLLAFWPVWPWYVTRMLDGSDEPLGFLALGTVLALCWLQPPQPSSPDQPRLLLWPLLSTLGYVLGYAYLPPLLRAALAMLALGCTLSRYWCGRAYHVGLGGLLLLALPLVASLQFYVGYPLRLVTAALTALLLRLSGFAVYQEGPGLHWGGLTVGVDAPCSGIYMCWTGVYLALTLACVYRLSTWQTWHALAVALVVLVLGNTLRTAALFYPEAGIVVL